MAHRNDDGDGPLELVDEVQPPGKIHWNDDLTSRPPSARVAEDASAELGDIGPDDPHALDLPFDISPDGVERRGVRSGRQIPQT